MTRQEKFIYGLGTGVIIGTAAGMLLAPKTGRETRNLVAARAGGLRQKATLHLGNLRRRKANGREADAAKEQAPIE